MIYVKKCSTELVSIREDVLSITEIQTVYNDWSCGAVPEFPQPVYSGDRRTGVDLKLLSQES
ncbi:hypothetical protein DPMN_191973 [Dreissena polymorpha]|uniref:Uncharacterized protein n=1 Tax=Dreissena polymorpha TaxID=45954 RepID=A0A9D4BD36_DREPO|nr:hypothetical protein DPMN_191973 [Dreissena polymorpha]